MEAGQTQGAEGPVFVPLCLRLMMNHLLYKKETSNGSVRGEMFNVAGMRGKLRKGCKKGQGRAVEGLGTWE